MELVFATNNKHKIKEINDLLDDNFTILGLADTGITEDIPEEAETLEENALFKARYVHEKTGLNVFADDTGLEVPSLGGAPGVHSARYAGESKSFDDNIEKLLREMKDMTERSARFRTVIALILDGSEYLFEGTVEGEIIRERRGSGGFGYDPVFLASGYDLTFAEIPLSEKNRVSHRAKAMRKLIGFLSDQKQTGAGK
ncbi:MAG TPA: non-canonical purine NTP diphosphatase [Bacteroidales bacterium]|jgi:XTP/dITP diphosphohydrolase|nr:non-canonical purine NTP diphosphatase [Bacteroidales bacterium]MDI9533727.1 non-canonical purine NTP diphosphatase [Bacteroidota bacterium]MBK7732870.1 non-canonical purine NTP diphosphatase [Bacteroidales bacterium]MBP7036751.1 non-canonical purine NTP diphosphatase [Bacteroidales bacterium]MBP8708976.1 non-canonical purine NTP diphosphatase [Bacteroidales bacterium]